tara:strand:+ start:425 stop:967 length:543 start_codon:yes stop_codon:yes gene_type:complete
MPFSINNFRANLTGQGARPNLFEITVPFPTSVATGEAGQKITFMCKTAQLPGADLGLVEVPYFGRNIKLAGNRTFAEWTTTIINDEDFAVHAGLTNWMNGINTHAGNERAITGTDYQVDAVVKQYAKTGDVAKEITIINCWPASVAPIELGWDQNDAIEEYAVTWQYDYWQANDGVHQTT